MIWSPSWKSDGMDISIVHNEVHNTPCILVGKCVYGKFLGSSMNPWFNPILSEMFVELVKLFFTNAVNKLKKIPADAMTTEKVVIPCPFALCLLGTSGPLSVIRNVNKRFNLCKNCTVFFVVRKRLILHAHIIKKIAIEN